LGSNPRLRLFRALVFFATLMHFLVAVSEQPGNREPCHRPGIGKLILAH
jgi:hypothetical protein